MNKYYRNKWNNLIYWIEGEIVVCAEENDMEDAIRSSFSIEEFVDAVLNDPNCFEEHV